MSHGEFGCRRGLLLGAGGTRGRRPRVREAGEADARSALEVMEQETVRLAQPKIATLGAAERVEAARLLAALIRAALASGARRGAIPRTEMPSDSPRPRSQRSRSRKLAAALPMAHPIDGKTAARETAGGEAR